MGKKFNRKILLLLVSIFVVIITMYAITTLMIRADASINTPTIPNQLCGSNIQIS